MSSITPVSANSPIFQAELQAKVARLQKEALNQQGQAALTLINSALPPATGQNINIKI